MHDNFVIFVTKQLIYKGLHLFLSEYGTIMPKIIIGGIVSMTWVTVEEARENLKLWLEAEKAVATGQSYKIGGRSLTRASLNDIVSRIKFWRAEIDRLENGQKGARVLRAVPRDY